MEYIYDAAGNKCRQINYKSDGSLVTTDFVANFVYEDGKPVSVLYTEDRVVLNSTGTVYCNEAYIKDHLGNVRVACYYAPPSIKIRQVNSYYPFGMNIKGLTADGSATYKKNEYLYNGKMFQDEMSLGWLDYGARFYDAVLGRWHSIDQSTEKNVSWTPYNYVKNNPLYYFDPDGNDGVPSNLLTPITWTYMVVLQSQTEKYIKKGDSPVTAIAKGSAETTAIFAAPFIMVGGFLVSAEVLGPILAIGSSEFLTALKLTPEMLKYIAISNPALYETILAIIEVEATPLGVASLTPLTKPQYYYNLLKMISELKGDSEPKQEPKSDKKPKQEPKPIKKPKQEPKPVKKPDKKPDTPP